MQIQTARKYYLKLSRDQASLIIEAKLALSHVYSFEPHEDQRQNSLQYTYIVAWWRQEKPR